MPRLSLRLPRLLAAGLTVLTGGLTAIVMPGLPIIGGGPGTVHALDNTPWVLPSAPPRCTTQQAESGNVAGCIVAFYQDPASTGWGTPLAPGVGEGWQWNGMWY